MVHFIKQERPHTYPFYAKLLQYIKTWKTGDGHYIYWQTDVLAIGFCDIFFFANAGQENAVCTCCFIQLQPLIGFLLFVCHIENIGIATDIDKEVDTFCR